MSSEHECYICHKKIDLYTRWHDGKPICDNCLIGLIYPQEIEQKDQKIAELEKALELACEYIFTDNDLSEMMLEHYDGDDNTLIQNTVDYIKEQAKKELENE